MCWTSPDFRTRPKKNLGKSPRHRVFPAIKKSRPICYPRVTRQPTSVTAGAQTLLAANELAFGSRYRLAAVLVFPTMGKPQNPAIHSGKPFARCPDTHRGDLRQPIAEF
jgi:hypothetical protein